MIQWKTEHNIRCFELALLAVRGGIAPDRFLKNVFTETVENPARSGIIEERYNDGSHYTKDEHGRFTGSTSTGGDSVGSSSGGGSLTSSETLKLDDIQIGRSVGAKAKNYDVMDLATGEKYHFVEGTRLQNVEVFAGKGTRTVFRKAGDYAERYGGNAKDWQHVKGFGVLDTPDGDREAEVHWVQCQGIGKHEFFIKRWLD